MKTSVEISMYPLNDAYEKPILDFIERLNTYPALKIKTNTMSTQVFGHYDEVMSALNQEMKTSFEKEPAVVMVMKVINLGLG